MTELLYEPEANANLVRTHTVTKRNIGTSIRASRTIPAWVKWSMVSLFWVLLVYGSYSLAHYYIGDIRQQLQLIQQTNQTNVQELNKKLEGLQIGLNEHKEQAAQLRQQFSVIESELGAVKEAMSLTGDSFNNSAATKQALSERITALDKELEGLRKLIKKLEEAARAY
jgi:site-specific DNA-adenine methylase